MRARAARLIEERHFPLQADWRLERLSPAQRQLVEVCRALERGSSLVIFDEPAAALSEAETAEVLRTVRAVRRSSGGPPPAPGPPFSGFRRFWRWASPRPSTSSWSGRAWAVMRWRSARIRSRPCIRALPWSG